jgi:hypothetical protein
MNCKYLVGRECPIFRLGGVSVEGRLWSKGKCCIITCGCQTSTSSFAQVVSYGFMHNLREQNEIGRTLHSGSAHLLAF